jgi:hypothetical protein
VDAHPGVSRPTAHTNTCGSTSGFAFSNISDTGQEVNTVLTGFQEFQAQEIEVFKTKG